MLSFLFLPGLFLLSGVFDTLFTQILVYNGASSMRSMFSIFAYYFAQVFVGFLPINFGDNEASRRYSTTDVEEAHSLVEDENNDIEINTEKNEEFLDISQNKLLLRKLYVLSAILDICGYVIRSMGMVYCGSGLFQVAFSSVAVFSAIYSRVILGTYISWLQWLGIFIVTSGLCISPLSNLNQGDSSLVGIVLTLIGAQFYALSYIVNEYISRVPGNKGSKEICKNVGLINTCICLLVIAVDTVPNRDKLIYKPIAVKQSSLFYVLRATVLYIISHIVHSYALYSVQGTLGAIWTGLLQCLRACVVFISSHYLYCDLDINQCLTLSKILSTILVTAGIVLFTVGKQKVASTALPTQDEASG